jgi:hypothetical protein
MASGKAASRRATNAGQVHELATLGTPPEGSQIASKMPLKAHPIFQHRTRGPVENTYHLSGVLKCDSQHPAVLALGQRARSMPNSLA